MRPIAIRNNFPAHGDNRVSTADLIPVIYKHRELSL